ncbi:hypothetical protein HFO45_16990 [Rhizobium leguminosarum]|uniref:hypothetical protein n=1 Tax=Rhizobium leguminosarum TaxID=384 RepID=UPI001C938B90|nr:hypothetical protein [Rhizobium leguminosarum]MBY5649943.1 hypothetical protein [Rhizobium leguminosarum]
MADKKTPEELAQASFGERVKALLQEILPAIAMLVTLLAIFLSLADIYFDGAKKVTVEVDRIEDAQKYADESQRLFKLIVPQIDLTNMSADTQNNLAELAGSIAGAQMAINNLAPKASGRSWFRDFLSSSAITPAYAEEGDKGGMTLAVSWMRQGIVVIMIICITILLIGFLILYFKTNDPEKLKFADSMIRMIVGFYIGVVTGLLGIPPT